MEKIKDITSLKELEFNLKSMEDLLKNKKQLRSMGMSNVEILKLESKYKILQKEFEKISTIPDKFNELFGGKGWIAFESLSPDIMEKAIDLAENSDLEEAEKELLTYYSDEERVNIISSHLYKIPEFTKRRDIYKVALERHFKGDYTSAIPLFLMIMDGFVNDIESTGFFAKNTDLTAWDSIAAHSTGLSQIAKILNRGRNKTTIEPIDFPFRNGILHGRDLNYAHEKVSVKALHIILALGDWAQAKKKMEKGLSTEEYSPPSTQDNMKALSSTVEKYVENKLFQEHQDKWKKRRILIGTDIPVTGNKNDYEKNSPERSMVEFIEYINQKNFGNIARALNIKPEKFSFKTIAGEMREKLSHIEIKSFKFQAVEDVASAATNIVLNIEFFINGVSFVSEEHFRWTSVNELGDPAPRTMEGQCWKVEDMFTSKWEVYSIRPPK